MRSLFLIPARGGSKGIPHKNIKELNGKPLIHYSIDIARAVADDEDICVSTDDEEIIKCVEQMGLKVPFVRPAELASDTATTSDVICHAINYYKSLGKEYDNVVLLQPTSPLRKAYQVKEAMELYTKAIELNPTFAEAYMNLGVLKEKNNDYKGAMIEYDNAIKSNPGYADAYYNRGALKERLNDDVEAMKDFDKIHIFSQ